MEETEGATPQSPGTHTEPGEAQPQLVTLNVGGRLFHTTVGTLCGIPCRGSMLHTLLSADWQHKLLLDQQGAIFLDRDPDLFCHVLRYLRTSTTEGRGGVLPSEQENPNHRLLLKQLLGEAQFFCLTEMERKIQRRLHQEKRRALEVFSQVDLCREGGACLRAVDPCLRVLQLVSLDLRSCSFAFMDLRGVQVLRLARCRLQQVSFEHALLSSSSSPDSEDQERKFLDCDLRQCDFSEALLERVDFTGSQLTGAKFENALLEGACFERADLRDVDFTGSSRTFVSFQQAVLY